VIIGGSSSSQNVQGSCFMGLLSATCDSTEADVSLPLPRGGTISNFVFQGQTGSNSGIVIVLRVNGVNTAINCVTVSAPPGCTDLTDTVNVSLGDLITISASASTSRPASWAALLQ
jgi:hypothetical protein